MSDTSNNTVSSPEISKDGGKIINKKFAADYQMISLDVLIAAMFFVSDAHNPDAAAYLHRPSGEVYWRSDDELLDEFYDGEKLPEDVEHSPQYLSIPNKSELNVGKVLVFAFVARFIPHAYVEVAAIFRKPGPYRRFRDMLEEHGLLDQWRQFQDAGEKEAMRNWCRENGVAFKE
jgi:hypothetical protein